MYLSYQVLIVFLPVILAQQTNSKVLGMLAIRDLNKLLLVGLLKTEYKRDNKGPYFCINVDQRR